MPPKNALPQFKADPMVVLDSGGHFARLEVFELHVDDVRTFFRNLRQTTQIRVLK